MARTLAGAAALFLAVAVLWAAPSSLRPGRTVPDLADAVQLGWVLSWNVHQVVRRPWALFESNGFHPYPRSLAFTDHLLPEALLVAPVYWATGNPVLVFNAALLAALTLSALAMFALVRHLGGSSAAALLTGLAYAFNSFTQHELSRVHVLSVQWWPLAWLFLDRFVRQGGRTRDAALGAAALALQGLSGTYYLAYTLLLLPVWVPAAYVAARVRPAARQLRRLAVSLVEAALQIAASIERFHHLGSHGMELDLAREKAFRVSLIRRLLSDDPNFVHVAKDFIDINDFYVLLQRVIYPASSHGRLGGKASGLFLASQVLRKSSQTNEFLRNIKTPKAWYLTSDAILHFISYNDLDEIVEQKYDDIERVRQEYPYVVHVFKNSPLPPEIMNGLSVALYDFRESPLIARSSSLLEDRPGTSFAGKYKSLYN